MLRQGNNPSRAKGAAPFACILTPLCAGPRSENAGIRRTARIASSTMPRVDAWNATVYLPVRPWFPASFKPLGWIGGGFKTLRMRKTERFEFIWQKLKQARATVQILMVDGCNVQTRGVCNHSVTEVLSILLRHLPQWLDASGVDLMSYHAEMRHADDCVSGGLG